jgi:hypothetical protein
MAVSCLCGPGGARRWLVPRWPVAGVVTTRAGSQETHRIRLAGVCALVAPGR